MSLPNGERQYIFGQTDAGYAIADTFGYLDEQFQSIFGLPPKPQTSVSVGECGK